MTNSHAPDSATAGTVTGPVQPFDWRAHLKVHPAADMLPLPSADDLKTLAEDIKTNGIRTQIVLYEEEGGGRSLLDGRNRLDALALLGLLFEDEHGRLSTKKRWVYDLAWAADEGPGEVRWRIERKCDPYVIALSLNVHRRHLTAEQKRDLIAKLLKAKPEQSNRTIAEQTKTDHKTVATVRSEKESRGEIPHADKRTDSKGRKQPAKKRGRPRKAPTTPAPSVTAPDSTVDSAGASAERRKAVYAEGEKSASVPAQPEEAPSPAAQTPTTDQEIIQNAAARSAHEWEEIKAVLDARLPNLHTVEKLKLFEYIIDHPALANVKVPKRDMSSHARERSRRRSRCL